MNITHIDEYANHTGNISPSPLPEEHLRAIVPYSGSHYDSSTAIDVDVDDAGPSTVMMAKRGRGRPKGSKISNSSMKKAKLYEPKNKFVQSCPNFNSEITTAQRENGNKEIVVLVLMRFDAVRRRFCQLQNVKNLLKTAETNCLRLGVRTNTIRRIGSVPGIEIGDIFYFWGEMVLVGLHLQMVAGITYLTKNDGASETNGCVATSVVSSDRYDDSTEGVSSLVYTGEAAKDKDGVCCNQKTTCTNLALIASYKKGTDVRVIRGVQDPCKPKQKIYIYDGLYIVTKFWKDFGQKNCEEFKFALERRPDQPPGYAVWKEVEQWKNNGLSTRKGLILEDISNGSERLPIALVNDVDENDKTVPEPFDYQRSSINTSIQNRPLITCSSHVCSCDDSNCVCVQRTGGKLPYHDQILVCRRPMVHECGDLCLCAPSCNNRIIQGGLKLCLEVFKTKNCGWGLRSREPIRAGTFICEFSGLNTMGEIKADDDYLFDTSKIFKYFKWNYEAELTGEDVWEQVPEVFDITSHMVISAKHYGNIARFMNHSCDANLFWQPVEIQRNKEQHLYIAFFAKRHIPPLTELSYDYGVSLKTDEIGEDGVRVFKGNKTCLCGSLFCRGTFG